MMSIQKPTCYSTLDTPVAPLNAYEVGVGIRAMDNKYNTSFQVWIREPSNAQCIGVRLRRLGEEYTVEQLAQTMKWIAGGWNERWCRVLFRSVTHTWSEDRKKELVNALLKSESSSTYQLPPLRNARSRRIGRQTPYSLSERKRSVSYSGQQQVVSRE